MTERVLVGGGVSLQKSDRGVGGQYRAGLEALEVDLVMRFAFSKTRRDRDGCRGRKELAVGWCSSNM